MGAIRNAVLCLSLFGSTIFGENFVPVSSSSPDFLAKSDAVPISICKAPLDHYLEGYLQALIHTSYMDSHVKVQVKKGKIVLYDLPSDQKNRSSIINFIKDVPSVDENKVFAADDLPSEERGGFECSGDRPQIKGVWFPQMTELFQPLIADPRNVTYLLGYRSGDKVVGKTTINIALGDDFGVYRWIDAFWHGDLQVGIESGIWSVFNMNPRPNVQGGTELVNTDFYFGIPITYAREKWAFRLRAYHISGHLGDECMVNYQHEKHQKPAKRVNPSVEAVDFFTSYQLGQALRLYVGPGAYVHSDETYKWKPMYIQYGTEIRFLNHKFYSQRMYGDLFIAMHWRNLQELNWDFDGTYRAGYELSKLQGVGRKFRVWVGYHHGYSLEGQFAKEKTDYWEFDLNYGF